MNYGDIDMELHFPMLPGAQRTHFKDVVASQARHCIFYIAMFLKCNCMNRKRVAPATHPHNDKRLATPQQCPKTTIFGHKKQYQLFWWFERCLYLLFWNETSCVGVVMCHMFHIVHMLWVTYTINIVFRAEGYTSMCYFMFTRSRLHSHRR